MDPEKFATQDEEKGKVAKGLTGGDEHSANMWTLSLSHTAKHDAAMIDRWKSDMDGILIYTGVFSATVAAFLLESYKYLKPDAADVSSALLRQITQELAGISNGERLTSPTLEKFQPQRYVIHVNILWFLSLCLSLGCGLGATLVQQWLRRYIRLTQYSDAPVCRIRIRTFLFKGIQDYHVSWLVENTSIMLHAAIFLFFAGLVEFLFAINDEVADVILVTVTTFGVLYIILTLLPVISRQCPFQTPLSSIFWYTGHILAISFLYPFTCSHHVRARIHELQTHIRKGVDRHLMGMMRYKPELDKDALESTISMCHDEDELEAFVDAIPSYMRMGHNADSRIDDIKSLLGPTGKESPLRRRLALLFTSCTSDHKRIDEGARRRRAIVCCRAIWEISRAALSAKIKDVASVLRVSIGDTLQRLTLDSDPAIVASALRTMAIFKRALLEQQEKAETTQDARQSTDSIAKDVGGMKDPLPLPYQAGPHNEERTDERLNTVTEFTSKVLILIPHLGKPSYMDLEETKMTLEELCHGLNGRDFPRADQQRLVDVLDEVSRAHAQLESGNAVSTGFHPTETYFMVIKSSTRRLVSTLDINFAQPR